MPRASCGQALCVLRWLKGQVAGAVQWVCGHHVMAPVSVVLKSIVLIAAEYE